MPGYPTKVSQKKPTHPQQMAPLPSQKLTDIAPENGPKPKRKGLSSKHQFSGANWLLVSGRVKITCQKSHVDRLANWDFHTFGMDFVFAS